MRLLPEWFIAGRGDDNELIIYSVTNSPSEALQKRQELVKRGIDAPLILRRTDGKVFVDVTEGTTEP